MADEQVPAQRREERPLAKAGFTFLPQSWEQLFAYAKEICQTEFTPKSMRGSPGAVLAAWQKGAEVGMQPMASLQSIAVINGVTSIHSDGFWALVVAHPMCEAFEELEPAECLAKGYGECTIKRRGNPTPVKRRFTLEMAKTAKLLGKDNWQNYPGRMLQQRARHLAANDAVPEATQGLVSSEVARDYEEPRDVTPIRTPQALAAASKDDSKVEDPRQFLASTEKRKDDADNQSTQSNTSVTGHGRSDTPSVSTDAVKSGKKAAKADSKVASSTLKKQEVAAQEQTEKTQEEWIAECELWIENASKDELFADDNWLLATAIRQLKGTSNQLKVLKPFNDRRQALAKEAKD